MRRPNRRPIGDVGGKDPDRDVGGHVDGKEGHLSMLKLLRSSVFAGLLENVLLGFYQGGVSTARGPKEP